MAMTAHCVPLPADQVEGDVFRLRGGEHRAANTHPTISFRFLVVAGEVVGQRWQGSGGCTARRKTYLRLQQDVWNAFTVHVDLCHRRQQECRLDLCLFLPRSSCCTGGVAEPNRGCWRTSGKPSLFQSIFVTVIVGAAYCTGTAHAPSWVPRNSLFHHRGWCGKHSGWRDAAYHVRWREVLNDGRGRGATTGGAGAMQSTSGAGAACSAGPWRNITHPGAGVMFFTSRAERHGETFPRQRLAQSG